VPELIDFREGVETITKLVSKLADQIPTPIVLIDGRAGAGKSSFAEQLCNNLFRELESSPRLVTMEDLYEGWVGLEAGSLYLLKSILTPLHQGLEANWQVWDWGKSVRGNDGEPGNGWRSFAGGNVLIIEGCGSISSETALLANLRVWIESPEAVRRVRYSQRDGGKFDDQWLKWTSQEDQFIQIHKPKELVDWIVEN
jgi:uridine kinase